MGCYIVSTASIIDSTAWKIIFVSTVSITCNIFVYMADRMTLAVVFLLGLLLLVATMSSVRLALVALSVLVGVLVFLATFISLLLLVIVLIVAMSFVMSALVS